jgi:uncharacterized membrane protein
MIKIRNTLIGIVGVLSIAGVAFTIRFLFTGGENEGFAEYPTVTNLHVLPGLIYMALAPLQFLSFVREKYPRYHRWSGRILAVIGVVLGSTAMFISLVFPYSGLAEQIIVTGFGVFFVVSIIRGVLCAKAHQFGRHREWMMRAFSIGLSIVTMRLVFIPMLIATGGPTREDAELFSIVSFTIAFVIHAVGAELWIRYTRPN